MSRSLATVVLLAGLAGGARAEVADPTTRARPWLGISIAETDARWGGVAVVDVFDDTAASLCGLRAGDEILRVGRADVHDTEELRFVVQRRAVGDTVTIAFVRGAGVVHRCKARLGAQITDPTELLHRLVDRALPPFAATRRGDGTTVDDATGAGRVRVLALFSGDCDACAAPIQELAAAIDAQAGAGQVDVLALTRLDAAALDAYVQRVGLAVPVARDEGRFVARYLAELDQPTFLVVDRTGVVRFAASGPGPDGTYLDSAAYCALRALRARDDR